ncbi:hypothetical protein KKG46_05980 [Patescibacteria group bacterium]|uniref:Uncharacterized protein n=1 Tax=viral metagenome TaxID=1070528 RepID=A0A6H1ZUK3_9ZZZZ|nr:hypothetical protein [Patescibacteria group bacterium]
MVTHDDSVFGISPYYDCTGGGTSGGNNTCTSSVPDCDQEKTVLWVDPIFKALEKLLWRSIVFLSKAIIKIINVTPWLRPWRIDRNVRRKWRGYLLVKKGN